MEATAPKSHELWLILVYKSYYLYRYISFRRESSEMNFQLADLSWSWLIVTLTAFPIGRWRHDNVILLVFNLTLSLAKDDIPVEVSLWLFDLMDSILLYLLQEMGLNVAGLKGNRVGWREPADWGWRKSRLVSRLVISHYRPWPSKKASVSRRAIGMTATDGILRWQPAPSPTIELNRRCRVVPDPAERPSLGVTIPSVGCFHALSYWTFPMGGWVGFLVAWRWVILKCARFHGGQ